MVTAILTFRVLNGDVHHNLNVSRGNPVPKVYTVYPCRVEWLPLLMTPQSLAPRSNDSHSPSPRNQWLSPEVRAAETRGLCQVDDRRHLEDTGVLISTHKSSQSVWMSSLQTAGISFRSTSITPPPCRLWSRLKTVKLVSSTSSEFRMSALRKVSVMATTSTFSVDSNACKSHLLLASFHEINSHEINCHEINSHEINLPQDQLLWDQLATRSILTRSTCHKINSIFLKLKDILHS